MNPCTPPVLICSSLGLQYGPPKKKMGPKNMGPKRRPFNPVTLNPFHLKGMADPHVKSRVDHAGSCVGHIPFRGQEVRWGDSQVGYDLMVTPFYAELLVDE